MKIFRARVSSKQNLAGNFWYLGLSLVKPLKIDFQAGQFVMVTVDEAKNTRRAYSIASSPFINDRIGLLINVFPGGPGSSWALSCRAGDEVMLSGPFGKFILKNDNKKGLVFVAAGAGIAPIKSMIGQLVEKKDQRSIELWWGLRNQSDVFWRNYFQSLKKKPGGFRFNPTLSRPKGDWRALKGRVTDHLKKLPEQKLAEKNFYICGSPAMVEDVKKILLKKRVPETSIFYERF